MNNILVQKNPFPSEKCEMKKCILCSSVIGNQIPIPCNSSNVGYQLACDTCKLRGIDKVYEGETSWRNCAVILETSVLSTGDRNSCGFYTKQ